MALSDEDVREILRIIDESELAELHIETEGFSLYVRKGGDDAEASERRPARPAPEREPGRQSPGRAHASAPVPTQTGESDGLATITAPMLGTFYRAEGPGKPPFVEVGSRVEADTIVCIIEVMKMMNSVPAGIAGTVAEVIPDNADLVEYGQPLFRVAPV
jgi:acetyl-CoA carboxylase biotin carboxyl carrier protein